MGGGSESKKQLGKILLAQKLVSADELAELLEEQKRDPSARLASAAARRGRIAVVDALRALSEQHGVPAVDLAEIVIPLSVLRLIPIELAREHGLLPFRVEGDRLLLAMASPDVRDAIEEIEFVASKKVAIHVALDHVLRHVIDYAYERLAKGDEHYVGAHVTEETLAALGLPNLPRAPEPLEPAKETADADERADEGEAASEARAPDAAAAAAQAEPTAAASPSSAPAALSEVDPAFGARVRPSQRPQMQAAAPDARVLLALRDAALRAQLAAALSEHAVPCSDADDGVAALELVRSDAPTLCVLEPQLPSVQGLDICRRLRASTRYAALPIVLLCDGPPSWRFVHDLREGFGVRHVFGRPCELPPLLQTIRLLLQGAEIPEEPPPLGAEAEGHWSRGMAAFEAGALPDAIVELEAGLALEPDGFELLHHLGLLYGRRDDLFSAMRVLERAATLQPKHFGVIKNLAVVYQRAGMTQSAIDAWQRARLCAPDDATTTAIREHLLGLL